MTYTFVLCLTEGMVSGKNRIGTLYRNGKPIRFPAKRFKEWRDNMTAQLHQQYQHAWMMSEDKVRWGEPLPRPLSLTIDYWPCDPYQRDLTGMADAVFHLLEHTGIVKNDGHIKHLHFIERERLSTGRLELTLACR